MDTVVVFGNNDEFAFAFEIQVANGIDRRFFRRFVIVGNRFSRIVNVVLSSLFRNDSNLISGNNGYRTLLSAMFLSNVIRKSSDCEKNASLS